MVKVRASLMFMTKERLAKLARQADIVIEDMIPLVFKMALR